MAAKAVATKNPIDEQTTLSSTNYQSNRSLYFSFHHT
ncbi:MAG: hypothetical protein ACJAVF_004137, partial [Paraglaciecola sp.]